MKEMLFSIFAAVITIVLPIIGGGIFIRGFEYVQYGGTSPTELGNIALDEALGWRSTENHKWHDQKLDAGARDFRVDYTTDKNGFRMFGNPHVKEKAIVFFVGPLLG